MIAAGLGRAASTVSREVAVNGGRARYRPVRAHKRAFRLARRPKPTLLGSRPELCEVVIAKLEKRWSPQQIARWLKKHPPDASLGVVSHETIYKSIYIQGRGELRRELARCLRSGRAARRPRGRMENPGGLADMVMISERPAEAADRAVPGHWEGDLIVGKGIAATSPPWSSAPPATSCWPKSTTPEPRSSPRSSPNASPTCPTIYAAA